MSRTLSPQIPNKTLQHLEWQHIIQRLADHCSCQVSRPLALQWSFANDESELRQRLQKVDEARSLLDSDLQVPLGELFTVTHIAQRASRGGVLDAQELRNIGVLLDSAHRVRSFFSEYKDSHIGLYEISEHLVSQPHLANEILKIFNTEGEIQDHASGELSELRRRVSHLHESLKTQVHSLLSDDAYQQMLQDDFYTIREDRYVLPVKSGHKRHIEGIVHGWSSSGATVYIEPKVVVDANNRLKIAQSEVKQEVYRILRKLSHKVAQFSQPIIQSYEALIKIDLAMAAGRLSKELQANSPILSPEHHLVLKQARHPLLLLAGVDVVANDIEVGEQGVQVLVVTGPNAGGKTVVMKTAGLIVLMALAGLHIPADAGSVVPLFPCVFSDMGDDQSLGEGQSTFSGHISNIQSIFKRLKPNSLVLLDELAIGTDPLQGSALAQAILEYLAEKQSLVFVTTHYEALKLLPTDDTRFRNAAVEYDDVQSQATYTLRYDIPGSSSAFQIARRFGLPSALLDRAQELTTGQQQKLEAVISQLEQETIAARQTQKELEKKMHEIRMLKTSLEIRDNKLKKRLKNAVEHERSQSLKKAKKIKQRIERLSKKLQDEDLTLEDLTQVQQDNDTSMETVRQAQLSDKVRAHPQDLQIDTLEEGQKVWVLTMDNYGTLVRLPDRKGRCQVQVGLLGMQVDVKYLRRQSLISTKEESKSKPKEAFKTKKKKKPAATSSVLLTWAEAAPQVPDNTCDVRGLRGDAAITQIINFLDEVYGRGMSTAFIIHGHGTGALKRHVRSWLPSCDYVQTHRAGQTHEGGDGVTAVLLTVKAL